MKSLKGLKPKTVGFFAYQSLAEQAGLLRRCAGLWKEQGWKVLAVPALKRALGSLARYRSAPLLAKASGLLLSLGGDGTLLGAAQYAAPLDRPVLGLNLGGLGFMTALGPHQWEEALAGMLKGSCRLERRSMVRGQLLCKGKPALVFDALNDIVLARAGVGRLARLDALVDGIFLASFRSDGLVFSSPTGSTAYALALGGPVVGMDSPVNLLTQVSPHTLSSRPVVLPKASELELRLPQGGLQLASDGRPGPFLRSGDRLLLTTSPYTVTLVQPPGHDAWKVLRDKLGWQDEAARGHRA